MKSSEEIRVLIADDETLVRQGLKSLIESIDGFRVIEEASNGDTALKQIRESRPDLIVLDVKMPLLSGLEVLSAVRNDNLATKCIILSGHDDFQFAREAISLQADDYLLKPANIEDLHKVLERIRNLINLERDAVMEGLVNDHRIKVGMIALQADFYRKLIHGDLRTEEFDNHYRLLGIESTEIQIVVFQADDIFQRQIRKSDDSWKTDLNQMNELVTSRLHQLKISTMAVFPDDESIIVALDPCSIPPLPDWIEGIKRDIQIELKIRSSVFIGTRTHLESANLSYQAARDLMPGRLMKGGYRVFTNKDLPNSEENEEPSIEKFVSDIRKSLRFLDSENLQKTIRELFAELARGNSNPEQRIECAYRILTESLQVISEIHPDFTPASFTLESTRLLDEVSSLEDMEAWLKSRITTLMKLLEDGTNRPSLAIKKALSYIERNFRKSISLKELAEYACLSPTYLSNLFKKETGRTFHEHLIGYRISAARKLLRQEDMTISEVAWDIGYENPRYFSEVFRKETGKTPREFRKGELN